MVDYYIKQLSITGFDVQPAVLDFQRGTNIVYGVSDAGKSYVAECLSFLFGAKSMRLKASSGYSAVNMTIETPKGEIFLSRRFDVKKKTVSISSTDPDYIGLACTGMDRDVLDSFWMRLIGIGENQTIVSSSYFAREALKWNNISKLLILKENVISVNQSAIPSSIKQLSTLLFLLTGDDYIEEPEMESDADRRKKEAGKKKHIEDQMAELAKRQASLYNQLGSQQLRVTQKEWDALLERFTFEEQRLHQSTSESRSLHKKLGEAQKQLSSYLLQAENHKLLRGLYDAQAKRLAFTLEGQLLTYQHSAQCSCPFCGNTIESKGIDKAALDATRAEFEQAGIAIHHFQNANNELNDRIERLQKQIQGLEKKCDDIDRKIASSYAPTVAELKEQLKQYLEFVRIQHEFDLVNTDLTTLQMEKDSLGVAPTSSDVKFKPKDEFPDDFRVSMSGYLHDMLTTCAPGKFKNIRFEMATMDISMERQDKDTFGEGWRAVLNTSVAFALFRHLCEHGKYVPGLLIIDSPIQAMKQPEGSHLTTLLINYIIQNSVCGQVFLIENELPEGLDVKHAAMFDLSNGGLLPNFKHPVKYRKDAEGQKNESMPEPFV